MDEQPPRTFATLGPLPPRLRVPAWLALVVLGAIGAGAALGLLAEGPWPQRIVRATFYGAAAAYLTTSLVDFVEHFRLEKAVAGRFLAWQAIPPGETINHALTVSILIGLLTLARPPPPSMQLRDWFVLAAPAMFLALGWRDELVYHRRRSVHREDLMHTVAHLAAGVMLGAFIALRMVRWDGLG